MSSVLPEHSDDNTDFHMLEEKYRTMILRQREELRVTIATARQKLVEAENENDKLKFEIEDLRHENAALRRESVLVNPMSVRKVHTSSNIGSDDELLISAWNTSGADVSTFVKREESQCHTPVLSLKRRNSPNENSEDKTPKRTRVVLAEVNDIRINHESASSPETSVDDLVNDPLSLEMKQILLNGEIPQYSKTQGGVVISPAMAASLFRLEQLGRPVSFPQEDDAFAPLVSRKQMRDFYGGESRKFAQYIRKKEAGHLRGRMLIFPSRIPTLTGHLPDRAGSHGLTFGSKSAIELIVAEKRVCSMFLPTGPDCKLFEYYGDYRMSFCGHLSKEQFAGQERKVQMAIVHEICDDYSSTHNFMIARVSLRKRGAVLTDANVYEEVKIIAKLKKQRFNFKYDILNALLSGQERVAIVRLICVGFDKSLVKDLVKKMNGMIQTPVTTPAQTSNHDA